MAFQTSKINPNKKYTFYIVIQDTHAYLCVYNEHKLYTIIFTVLYAVCSSDHSVLLRQKKAGHNPLNGFYNVMCPGLEGILDQRFPDFPSS